MWQCQWLSKHYIATTDSNFRVLVIPNVRCRCQASKMTTFFKNVRCFWGVTLTFDISFLPVYLVIFNVSLYNFVIFHFLSRCQCGSWCCPHFQLQPSDVHLHTHCTWQSHQPVGNSSTGGQNQSPQKRNSKADKESPHQTMLVINFNCHFWF